MADKTGLPTQTDIIIGYYTRTAGQYLNYGGYADMPGLYALHSGFYPEGLASDLTHRAAIAEMDHRIMSWLGLEEDKAYRIADLGCGTGVITFLLAWLYPEIQVDGVTLVPVQVEAALKYQTSVGVKNATIHQGDFSALDFPDNTFDRVLFVESLTHAGKILPVLQEAFRVLKPGGLLHFQETLQRTPADGELQRLSLDTYKAGFFMPDYPLFATFQSWLKEAGFSDISTADITANVYPSALEIGNHAQMRLDEGVPMSPLERLQRQACVQLRDLMRGYLTGTNLIGYFTIQAIKP